ncbi:MAG: hypothetical protein IKD72_05350 [Clostridia bacterium]|nr:hypothetical protein [Clostridia bacterium]
MNIIEAVREILTNYPKITEFSNGLHVDYTVNQIGDFGLYSTGDALVKKTIIGGERRRHSFVLYACHQSFNDYDRLSNSSFLLELGYWLAQQHGQQITAGERSGRIVELSSANAMLFAVPTNDIADGCTYQVQIHAIYDIDP